MKDCSKEHTEHISVISSFICQVLNILSVSQYFHTRIHLCVLEESKLYIIIKMFFAKILSLYLFEIFTVVISYPLNFDSSDENVDYRYNYHHHYFNELFLEGNLPQHNIDITPIDRTPSLTPDIKYAVRGENGVLSSDLKFCNNLVIDSIIELYPNANAADMAVTLTLCIGMVNFFNSGIGGGGYLVMHDHSTKTNMHLDFRELSPLKADPSLYKDNDWSTKVGGLAIATPGELLGLYELFRLKGSGTIRWSELLKPIIDLGNQGWEVDEILGATLKIYEPVFTSMPETWFFVLNSTCDGVLKQGDWIRRPQLAHTLQLLAQNESVAPFYDPTGPLVKSMVQSIQNSGGIITGEDFKNYRVHQTDPLTVKIRSLDSYINGGLTVVTSSGSSSGAALVSALKIMDHFPDAMGGDYLDETNFYLIETMKWMGSARSRLGDYQTQQLPDRIMQVLHDQWSDQAHQSIRNQTEWDPLSNVLKFHTMSNYTDYRPEYKMNEPHGTAHISIIDHHGNAVSLTTTINLLFGSLVHDPETGVIFNNEMDDFAQESKCNSFELAASIYNLIEPLKRPLSSTAPTIVLNELGVPDLVIGASGGSRITTAILQSLIRLYWYKMPLLETVAYPRVHHQLLPDHVEVENISMIGKGTITKLMEMGYEVIEQVPKSVVNAIKRDRFGWIGVSDYWRKRGISQGY